MTHPLSESQWNREHLKWESEKHKRWSLPAEGFRGDVTGKWGACGWSVVQSDQDGELGPVHAVYGTRDAELEVQRTIKTAELTAFLSLLKKIFAPPRCMLTMKELSMGCGEEK